MSIVQTAATERLRKVGFQLELLCASKGYPIQEIKVTYSDTRDAYWVKITPQSGTNGNYSYWLAKGNTANTWHAITKAIQNSDEWIRFMSRYEKMLPINEQSIEAAFRRQIEQWYPACLPVMRVNFNLNLQVRPPVMEFRLDLLAGFQNIHFDVSINELKWRTPEEAVQYIIRRNKVREAFVFTGAEITQRKRREEADTLGSIQSVLLNRVFEEYGAAIAEDTYVTVTNNDGYLRVNIILRDSTWDYYPERTVDERWDLVTSIANQVSNSPQWGTFFAPYFLSKPVLVSKTLPVAVRGKRLLRDDL